MVMSFGRNEYYKNTVPSAEVHVLHEFDDNFYGVDMRLLITGFIREMRDYPTLEVCADSAVSLSLRPADSSSLLIGPDPGHQVRLRCSAQQLGPRGLDVA